MTSAATLEAGQDLPEGYPQLGQKMGLNPEMAIFRRFAGINAQILLHKQCALIRLEAQYRESERLNSKRSTEPHNILCRNAAFLTHPDVAGDHQIRLLAEIESKLKEYGKALKLQQALANMPEPSKFDIAYLQHSMVPADEGVELLPLTGADGDVWGVLNDGNGCSIREAPDLVALHGRREVDPFSRWVTGSGLQRWFACGLDCGRKPSKKHGVVGYSEKALLRLTSWVTTIIASALPVVSILILDAVQSMRIRLGIVAVFNVLVSLCLLLFSDAKRSEIFAVAAGFAAVQVVFVGTASVSTAQG